MAATASGKDKVQRYARLFVGGYDLSGSARAVGSLDNNFGEVDITGWSESVKNFLADYRRVVGIRGFQAIVDDTAGKSFAVLKDAPNDHIVTMGLGGGGEPVVPDPAYLVYGLQLNDNTGWEGGAAIINADFIPSQTNYNVSADNPWGHVLQGASSLSSTTTGSSHDNEAASSNGFHAHLHVLATSSGNFAITIEHSTNDSAWATLATFTSTAGAITAERQVGTGTVNRYVRSVLTRTAGTITVFIAYARN